MDPYTNDRDHGPADFMVLLAVARLGLAAWISLADATELARWKVFLQFMPTVVFALASLTRHLRWAMVFRFLTGGWVVVAPFVLGFANRSLVVGAGMTTGLLVVMALLPWRLAPQKVR